MHVAIVRAGLVLSAALLLAGCTAGGGEDMSQPEETAEEVLPIPPVDRSVPDEVLTATFALG
ncbi:MAG: hypothetical protein ACOC6A_00885 [Chloroflexota bacterium]